MDLYAKFANLFPTLQTERDFSFAKHTTIGCGGTAALAVSPRNTEESEAVLAYLTKENIPHCFLGAGANVLPADGMWEGVVVRFNNLRRLHMQENLIFAGAGVTGGELIRFVIANSLGGLEPLAGIPMTVGGGAAMNAGIRETHFSDLVVRVEAIERGKAKTFGFKECCYSEKNSVFLHGIAISGVWLRAQHSDCVAQTVARYISARDRLPKGRSMGCTFVNPEGKSAGELIDRCGLKGYTVGKAHISQEHANFIINEGNSSQDVSQLISIVKEEVFRQTGILLREEIRRIGKDT